MTDRKATETLGRRLEELVALKVAGQPFSPDVTRWLETIPDGLRQNLARIGLIRRCNMAALRPLMEHLEGADDLPGFRQYLTAKGDTPKQVSQTVARARRIVERCGFTFWSDIVPTRVLTFLDSLRGGTTGRKGIGAQTFNFYLSAFKSFCRWLVRDGRASENPVQYLTGLNVRTDRRHDRRALSVTELRWLLDTTAKEPSRFGMSGADRALCYRVAVETGMRAGELVSLTKGGFTLDGGSPCVRVTVAYSKHRREDELPLRPDTARRLEELLRRRISGERAFPLPGKPVKMLRADLAAARAAWIQNASSPEERKFRRESDFLAYRDSAGRFCDFHALRHTTGSLLAATGAHPKVAQMIMRHSDINLTLSRYTHSYAGQQTDAIAALPDLGEGIGVEETGAVASAGEPPLRRLP